MITPEKIEEWIREVEERPSSAATILRYIANRLSDLTNRNEELLGENIALRSGHKVEDYESRITNLEYQVELLKRQLDPEASLPGAGTTSILVYHSTGQVLRFDLEGEDFAKQGVVAQLSQSLQPVNALPRLMATHSQEELLFVFDSGRTVALPVLEVPAVDRENLDLQRGYAQELRGIEELALIQPIATMSLYDFCIQASRRGYLKKIREGFFESCVANQYIGAGIQSPSDKPCELVLSNGNDSFVMVSEQGFLFSMLAQRLPVTLEAAMRLNASDHIVAAFVQGQKPSLIFITQDGKAVHRHAEWIELAGTFKTKGQAVFSKERRTGGTRLAGAAAVEGDDWGIALVSDGRIVLRRMADLFGAGSFQVDLTEANIVAFASFSSTGVAA